MQIAVRTLNSTFDIFVKYNFLKETQEKKVAYWQLQNLSNKVPSWMKHLLTHTFFDSDTMLLYKQEQMLRSKNKLNDCLL